ncbi:MAG: hypothetical protein ABSC29_02435 [Minisyncoccia bacterium]|jgi:hypothetical protein
MGRLAFVIVAIVLLGALIYAYNSGMISGGTGGLNLTWLLPHFTSSSLNTNLNSPYIPPAAPPTGTFVGSVQTSSPNSWDVPAGFTASQLSPYFHQVRFGGVSAGSLYSYGQISFYAYPTAQTSSIDVTSWHIKSNRGGEYIPQAVTVYDPLGLNPATDILLKNGDMLNLYSTWAPVNLRLNKCIGYLPNKTQFNPQLPQNCPYIDRSTLQSFSGACQNYILSLGSCQMANLSDIRIPQNDYSCVNYLQNNFNYKSCFDAHYADADFLSHEVRAWTGSSPLDQSHDNVYLFDRNGLLVDTYSY